MGAGRGIATPLVFGALWTFIEPPFPPEPNSPRYQVDDRAAPLDIQLVLRTSIPWQLLPKKIGCGPRMTSWRRQHEWQEKGVWERIHLAQLDRLGYANAISGERAAVDNAAVPARREVRRARRTQQTAASTVPSATSSSMPTASRSP
ncbi:transposase [Azospirillum sp. RWY-5-1]|nr:transposase [Azospirillum oleiclasticum]